MKANFEIQNFIEVCFDGKLIDLHNCYEFHGFIYDNPNSRVTLNWLKTLEEWVQADSPGNITIMHNNVTYLKVLPMTEIVSVEDSQTLSEVTFYPATEREEDKYLIYQTKPGISDDIIYTFIGGQIILSPPKKN